MPAMVLTSVDFPAPLSPTSPTTSPAFTSKSTLFSACTGPNRLLTPFNCSRGAFAFMSDPFRSWGLPGAAAGWRLAPPGRNAAPSMGHAIPAALHADAKADVQICDDVQNPSLTIVLLMLALVTATGVRIV